MLTLTQIKNRLKDYLNNHAQVNSVVVADDFEFNAERNLNYPAVNIEYVNADMSDKLMIYSFRIVIGDLVSADEPELQLEVHSDCLLIAEDLFSFLQYQDDWLFRKTSSINKFVDDSGDRVSGVEFRINISVVRSQNP